MFNSFVFNSLGFNYLGVFHYSLNERPIIQNVFNIFPYLGQVTLNKPLMVDGKQF